MKATINVGDGLPDVPYNGYFFLRIKKSNSDYTIPREEISGGIKMTETVEFYENEEPKKIGVWSWIMKKINNLKSEENEMVDILKKAQADLDIAMNNYEFADEPALVDYYTYNIKAAQMKYEYLLKKAKEQGM